MQWGNQLKLLLETAKGATTEEEVPYALRSRPSLNQFQAEYWTAYQEVSGSRQYTASGVAEIPYMSKLAWLDENGVFDADDRRDILQAMTEIDSAYLEHFYEKNKVNK